MLKQMIVVAIAITGMVGLAQTPKTRVAQTVELSQEKNGIDGELRLLVDSRLSDAKLAQEQDCELREDPTFRTAPAAAATVQIVDRHGELKTTEPLEKPIANIQRVDFLPGYEVIEITVNDQNDFGTYSGSGTALARVVHGRINYIKAKDADTEKVEPIYLGRTGKQEWQISSPNIYDISCHPPFPEPKGWDGRIFAVDYITYHFDGNQWLKLKKTRLGFWEAGDDAFPTVQQFPH